MLAYVNIAQCKVTLAQLKQRKFPKEMLSAKLDEDMGELMEYRKLMNNLKYRPLCDTTKGATTNSGATSNGGDTPDSGLPIPLRRSPLLASQRSQIEDEVDVPSHKTRSHTRQNSFPTQETMLAYVNIAQCKVTLAQLKQRKFPKEMLSAKLDEDMGELMEYRKLMNNLKYRPLYQNSYDNEIGQLAQGMSGLVDRTNTIDGNYRIITLFLPWEYGEFL